jgi:hypothetical protein
MDITRSGTRKEELLVAPDQLKKMYILRRILNPMGTMDAIDFLLDKLRNTKTNGDFFESMNACMSSNKRAAAICKPQRLDPRRQAEAAETRAGLARRAGHDVVDQDAPSGGFGRS